jgi:regulator of protease activity HflC (stomatin/prohibitin superfamily)
MEQYITYALWGALGLFALITLILSCFTVEQQTAAIIQRFGKFARIAKAGLNIKIPWLEKIAYRKDLRIRQLDIEVETKTQDDVFVKAKVVVQYYVIDALDKIYASYYKLSEPQRQIESFVFDVVRAQVPKMKLDEVFAKKDDIGDAVKKELTEAMDDFGYGIHKALVTDIDPDHKVKEAMNEINAQTRMRIAATEKGEADKILKVKAAEADAQSKALQGKGIADQRRAIVEGLRESVSQFQESVQGASAQDVMTMVLLTQYLDTMKEIGASSRGTTILMPHSPGALADLKGQIQSAIMTANQVPGPLMAKPPAAPKPDNGKKA